MDNEEKINALKSALICMMDEYGNSVANACHCGDEYGYEEDEQCPYCYARDVLKKVGDKLKNDCNCEKCTGTKNAEELIDEYIKDNE